MALIKTIAEFQAVASVDQNLTPEVFLPYINKAEERYLRDILGDITLDNLETAYNASTMTTAQRNLLTWVQMAVGPLAVYLMAPNIAVRITNNGVQVSTSENFNAANDRDIYFMRISYLNDGMNAIDSLCKFLERNESTYTDWASSSSFATYKQYFINRASQFQQYANIGGSAWIFRNIVPLMNQVELRYVRPLLSTSGTATPEADFYTYLKTQWAADAFTDHETQLMTYICNAIANYTYNMALLSPNIIQEMKLVIANRAENFQKNKIDIREYDGAVQLYKDIAQGAISDAVDYLNKNASSTVFPLWFGSANYIDPNKVKPADQYGNRRGGSTFAMM